MASALGTSTHNTLLSEWAPGKYEHIIREVGRWTIVVHATPWDSLFTMAPNSVLDRHISAVKHGTFVLC